VAQPSIMIVNPVPDGPGYHTAEFVSGWGAPSHVSIADLTSVTLAAMVPSDWDVSVTDEGIDPVDFTQVPDFVAITGKVSQRNRMISLAEEFRRRGSVVLIGGPYASLNPDDMRPHADILVTGEIEEIASDLFADLKRGRWRDVYVGTKPDLRMSPLPRWDLYPNKRAVLGTIQTSRGCPFDCEFCDVIQYLGRKQRHKEPDQVIRELDVLYRAGYREVFLADDNFTVYRKRASDLLAALKIWNDAHANDPVRFMTQASIDVARDDELLDQSREAGLATYYIGVETINEDSLREANKRQNLLQGTEDALANILGRGISVLAGIIVGFDNDGPDIFDRQYDFIQRSGMVDVSVGLLIAPHGTPLYARMKRDGRLSGDEKRITQNPWFTNIVPARMTQKELIDGLDALCQRIYAPEAFQERLDHFLDAFGARLPRQARIKDLDIQSIGGMAIQKIAEMGPGEAALMTHAVARLRERPDAHRAFFDYAFRYAQARYLLNNKDKLIASAA
jgi:radical SAM superfamily enzyme YgiQ (UPF0313 family)